MNNISLKNILNHLQSKKLLDEAGQEKIQTYLNQKESQQKTPWYIKMFITFGAWIAAGCFIAFLAISGLMPQDERSLIAMGIIFLAIAVVLYSNVHNIFFAQLALAVSVLGHIMTFMGVYGLVDETFIIPLTALILCFILYPLYKDSLHRFLSCLVVTASTTGWLIESELHQGIHVLLFLEIFGVGLIFTHYWDNKKLYPLAYALAVSVPLTLLLVLVPHETIETIWWPSNIILILGVLYLYKWALGEKTAFLKTEPAILAIIGTIAIGLLSTPGVIAAIGLLVLGYVLYDKALLGLGMAFFPVFIIVYYYDLDVDLLTKSWILISSGTILLFFRWYINYRPWAKEKSA